MPPLRRIVASTRSAGRKLMQLISHPRMNHICMSRKGRLTHTVRNEAHLSCHGNHAQSIENATLKRNTIDIMVVFNKMAHFQANEIFSIEPFVMLDIGGVWQEEFVRRPIAELADRTDEGRRAASPKPGPRLSAASGGRSSKPEIGAVSYGSRNVIYFHRYQGSCQ